MLGLRGLGVGVLGFRVLGFRVQLVHIQTSTTEESRASRISGNSADTVDDRDA